MRTLDEVQAAFSPVGKLNEVQRQKILHLESGFKDLALSVIDLLPEVPDRTAALRKLLEAKWTAIQAVTHTTEKPNATPRSLAGTKKES